MKKLSLRSLIPNLFTFISLTFGLTAIKFAIDEKWEINIDYCSNWSEGVALSKDGGYIMSNLVAYTNMCMDTLSKMTEMIYLEKN